MGVSMATGRNGAGGCGRWGRAASGAGTRGALPRGMRDARPHSCPGGGCWPGSAGEAPGGAFGAGKNPTSRAAQLQPVYYGGFFPGK